MLTILPFLLWFLVALTSKYISIKQNEKTNHYGYPKHSILDSILIFFDRILEYLPPPSYRPMQSDKGTQGEYNIYLDLQSMLGYKQLLTNCYVPKSNGDRTEIDLILIHESGIYVFESKNYSGWIFGSETDQYWTQTLPTGQGTAKKTQFLNPIIQNKVHLKWLKIFLKEHNIPFYSYIVFGNHCTLKNLHLVGSEHHVIYQSQLLSEINRNAWAMGTRLSSNTIDNIYNRLLPLSQADNFCKLSHAENVHRKYDTSNVVPNTRCPICGGNLILRTAKKGPHTGETFWGCSNFPKCRYIKKY